MALDDRLDDTPDSQVRWRVSGRVQGVGFRWFVREQALRLGIVGDVCNRTDGTVEVRASASEARLRELHEALATGPPGSRVDAVTDLDPGGWRPESSFDVRFPGEDAVEDWR